MTFHFTETKYKNPSTGNIVEAKVCTNVSSTYPVTSAPKKVKNEHNKLVLVPQTVNIQVFEGDAIVSSDNWKTCYRIRKARLEEYWEEVVKETKKVVKETAKKKSTSSTKKVVKETKKG